jgi:hypothetical protein
MNKPKILQEGESYTFRSFFDLPYEADDIVAEFGYSFANAALDLPRSARKPDRLSFISQQIKDILPLIRLSSETARREILVAPVLIEVARFCQCQLRIEYPLTVSSWLKGTLDYLLLGVHQIIVIEAKRDDLTRGFVQLAVEMIAIAQAQEMDLIYGAVTIGNAWSFGRLDRTQKQIFQDLSLYRVPEDLEELVAIIIGILEPSI